MTILERTDIEDGKRIVDIFTTLSEENKNMAIVYLSALRDRLMYSNRYDLLHCRNGL